MPTSRLATHLRMATEIQMSRVQVGRILKQRKYRYLWARYSLEDKQNPEQRLAFKHRLEEELSRSTSNLERLQVWFWDESGFSLRSLLWSARIWNCSLYLLIVQIIIRLNESGTILHQ